MAVGRDLPPGPQEGNPKEIGAMRKEKGASKEEGIGTGTLDSSRERQQVAQESKYTKPGNYRQGTRLTAEGQLEEQRKDIPRGKRKR